VVMRRLLSTSRGYQHLLVTQPRPHVFHVMLNRPEKMNAFNPQLWSEVGTVFDDLANDAQCRVVVLSGAGKAFSAGIDLKEGVESLLRIMQDDQLDSARKARALRSLLSTYQGYFNALEKCPKPVVAAIHGHCLGAGNDLITAADIRYASNDAIFSIKEVDLGLAADVGILNRINKLVGNDSLTRELAFTARDFNASQALQYGLISRLFATPTECLNGALALAEEMASKSPIAVQGTKLALNYSRDHSIEDSINFILTWNQSQLLSEDLILSVTAALTKQKANFKNV